MYLLTNHEATQSVYTILHTEINILKCDGKGRFLRFFLERPSLGCIYYDNWYRMSSLISSSYKGISGVCNDVGYLGLKCLVIEINNKL